MKESSGRPRTRTIRVNALARVEGEGALEIRLHGREIRSVRFRIYEPPRFFEAFLRGRSLEEVPDLTSRICGICPVAYQMSSVAALEDALGIVVGPKIEALRRILYAGEWIESHGLHVFMLHAPDFLGYPDAITMAQDHRSRVAAGLRIKKAGNTILERIGGRAIHPVSARVGGFHGVPTRRDLLEMLPELRACRDATVEALEWIAGFDFPELDSDTELVSLAPDGHYPLLGRRIWSSHGLDAPVSGFDEHFEERQVPHSTALHAARKGAGTYLCGPAARFEVGFEALHEGAREVARRIGLRPPCHNPFRSILIRGIEILHSFEESIDLIERYEPPDPPFVEAPFRNGVGWGASEAPRGTLFHRFEVDDRGRIVEARIIPPTSQNQAAIEHDLRQIAERIIELPKPEATHLAERTIRNFDPCISCATHFLRLEIHQEQP